MDSFTISLPQSSRLLATTLETHELGPKTLVDLSQLIAQLESLGVDGPNHYNLDGEGTLIGSGAQFDVYDNQLYKYYAYKRVKLPSAADSIFKTMEQRSHYRTIELEVASMCDPVRRTNPNIVQLLSWGFDNSNGDRRSLIPVLKVEKAICSLHTFLLNGMIESSGLVVSSVQHHLCLDIASGLQAIHHSGLAHGDLKPSNVLIFPQMHANVPFIAKLSDFGQCIVLNSSISDYSSYRGTSGWLPPEIRSDTRNGSALEQNLFLKCDAYTYGLLTMSVFLNRGESLLFRYISSNEPLSTICCSQLRELGLAENVAQKLEDVAKNELAPTPQNRRDVSINLLQCDSESFHEWSASRQYFHGINTASRDISVLYDNPNGALLDNDVLYVLEGQFQDPLRRANFSHATLFAMALSVLDQGNIDCHARAAGYLLAAARCSHIPAQAMMHRYLQAIPSSSVEVSDGEINKWLFNGARTGSLIAIEDLRKIDPVQADQASAEFTRDGGYNQNMSYINLGPFQKLLDFPQSTCPSELLDSKLDNAGNRPLHYAAVFGNTAILSTLLRQGAQVNCRNDKGETALYKACLAGNSSVVPILAEFQADARIRTFDYGISCLHWLFNFEESKQPEISQLLVDMGADVASRSEGIQSIHEHPGTVSLPCSHFPFRWPLGTPLHWATFARRPSTCDILLSLGSKIDRLDVPRNLKDNTAHTCLSLAGTTGDSLMIAYLLCRKANPNQLKRQKRGAIHFLATNRHNHRSNYVSMALKWWIFHGSWESHLLELTKCVDSLSSAGVNISSPAIFSTSAESPILLEEAIDGGMNGGALIALLKAGADPTCSDLHQHKPLLLLWCSRLPRHYDFSYQEELKATFESILEYTTDIMSVDDTEQNALHLLSSQGTSRNSDRDFKVLASFLLSRAPALLEGRDKFGRTPLLSAAISCNSVDYYSDSKTKPEILLDLNANIRAKSIEGVGFLQTVCFNETLSDRVCLRLAKRYLQAIDIDGGNMNQELEGALRKASYTLKRQVVKLLIPMVKDVNSPNLGGWNSFDLALHSSHHIRLRKLDEWILNRIIIQDQSDKRCYATRLQDGSEILKKPDNFLKDEKAVERLFDESFPFSYSSVKIHGVQRLDVEKYFGCIDILQTLKSVGAVKSFTCCYFGIRPILVRQRVHRSAFSGSYDRGACYKRCPKDEREPFWAGHWEILTDYSCSCRFSDYVSLISTLLMMCFTKEEESLTSIRDWLFCAIYATICALYRPRRSQELDEMFQENESFTAAGNAEEASEVEHLQVRWIRVVGRMQDENDVQLELGATFFDPTSKALKIPEPPPLKIEARGLRYTLPVSHLDWACITPSWIKRLPQPSMPEGGNKLSELQMRRLKHKKVIQARKYEQPAILDYLERFRWPQGQGPFSRDSTQDIQDAIDIAHETRIWRVHNSRTDPGDI